jgi:hypothetical protein
MKNTYISSDKKRIITFGLMLIAFNACHATAEFDTLKASLDNAFNELFDPAPEKFGLVAFKKDPYAPKKLANFNSIIKKINQFVTTHNKGLVFGASTNLDQANKTLVTESNNLLSMLGTMRQRLIEKGNFADRWDSQTSATQFHIDLVNMRDHIKPIRDTLRTKADDYRSTGQKESYALLVDALQDLHDGIEIVRNALIYGQWLKK